MQMLNIYSLNIAVYNLPPVKSVILSNWQVHAMAKPSNWYPVVTKRDIPK